jgi:peptidyl-prolyl cis-trans isomerase B (cyclophilin B)
MKRLLLLFLSLGFAFTLTACKDDEVEEIVHDVPKEISVNLQELRYAEYLTLNNPVVTITVEGLGDIVIQLFPGVAPGTVDNFIKYIEDGDYDDNLFHRVVNGFVIQGGQLESPECNIPGEMVSNDFDNELMHYRGVISMARIGDDYGSANSQFFIVQQTSTYLDEEYATFGGVVAGFNVLDYIASMQASNGEYPFTPVIITSITIDLNGYVPEERVCVEEE